VDSPETLSWFDLSRRLTAVMDATPSPVKLINEPCTRSVLRLRDIAEYCDVTYHEVCEARTGRRPLKSEIQKRLSWFFHMWERGRLMKELQADGKYQLVYQEPQAHTHETRPPAPGKTRAYVIDVTADGPKMRMK
jgi:hypothetical protein